MGLTTVQRYCAACDQNFFTCLLTKVYRIEKKYKQNTYSWCMDCEVDPRPAARFSIVFIVVMLTTTNRVQRSSVSRDRRFVCQHWPIYGVE